MQADVERPLLLPDTTPLIPMADPAACMVEGLHAFVDRELAEVDRARRPSGSDAIDADDGRALASRQRERLARLLGVTDQRLPVPALELLTTTDGGAVVGKTAGYTAYAVRWPVLDGVDGEGLLLQPKGLPRAQVVVVPDADWTPEQLAGLVAGVPPLAQFARHLAERGCQVVIPTLIDRQDTWSGNPDIRMTNQPHREYVYRMAFELGRHIIGYEVQKVLALVDYFHGPRRAGTPVGVYGYGEGGLLALYAAALDPRVAVTAVSGCFRNRRYVWQEPIYRDVWRLLRPTPDWPGFGDAQVAWLIAPRPLVVEAVPGPPVAGPPAGRDAPAPRRARYVLSPIPRCGRRWRWRARPTSDSGSVNDSFCSSRSRVRRNVLRSERAVIWRGRIV